MGLFNRKDKTPGDKVDEAMDKVAPKTPEKKPEGPQIRMVNMSGDENIPPEIKEALMGLLKHLSGAESGEGILGAMVSASVGPDGEITIDKPGEEHDCSCTKGHPRCKDTDMPSLVEWVKNFNVRIYNDPDDTELTYYAGDDVELAMLAAFRLAILGMQAGNVPDFKQEFAAQVYHNLMENAGVILGDESRALDLSKVEVPDSIPTDWNDEDE